MAKVCLIHGVGPYDTTGMAQFGERMRALTGCTYELYLWRQPALPPPDPRSQACLFGTERDFVWQVIMDFTYAVREFDAHASSIPDADFYVGHSAGGVLALARPMKPCVLMGCPVQLITQLHPMFKLRLTGTASDVLNIVHNRDTIAAPLLASTNEYYDNGSCVEFVNPIAAHTQYWHSQKAAELAANWLKQTVSNGSTK